MVVKNSVKLYECGLMPLMGYIHTRELIKQKKSVCFRVTKQEIQIMPAAWFINLNYGYASYLLMGCVYVYDKEKIKQYGLQ